MLKFKLAILSLISLFFLTTPVSAAELSCPDGGAPMEVQYGDVVNCSLEGVGDLDVYAIAATEGDFISANVTYTGNDECEKLRLSLRGLDEKNTALASGLANFCSGTRIEFTVDKTRMHTITVSDWSDKNTGEYQIEFQCISGSCIKQALLPKQECAATFDGSEFKVPYIEVNSKIFWADFKLISSNPIQVELTTANEK
jgi:hypothetical protein